MGDFKSLPQHKVAKPDKKTKTISNANFRHNSSQATSLMSPGLKKVRK